MATELPRESAADLLVVGGGIAGVTTATVAAEAGLAVMLVEKQDALGGSCVY
jgi:fumarate reductase flavoprotein subunit